MTKPITTQNVQLSNPLTAQSKHQMSIAKSLFKGGEPNFKAPAPTGQRPDPIVTEMPDFKPKNECNVIKIIQKEWEREVERLNIKKYSKRPMNASESKSESLILKVYFLKFHL